jgi:signal transduction histidine kinase
MVSLAKNQRAHVLAAAAALMMIGVTGAVTLRFSVGLLLALLPLYLLLLAAIVFLSCRLRTEIARNSYVVRVFAQDIKSRMQALKIFLRAMEKDYPDDDSLLYALQSQKCIQNAVGNLINVFTEAKTGPRLATVSSSVLAREFTNGWAALLRNKNILFTVEAEGELSLRIDPDAMSLVWENLLSNAYQYTHRGGTVAVRFFKKDDSDCVAFVNSGETIPPPRRPTLFHRSLAAEKQAPYQRGLGLYSCALICRRHGGELVYEVDEKNMNAFIVRLPRPAA